MPQANPNIDKGPWPPRRWAFAGSARWASPLVVGLAVLVAVSFASGSALWGQVVISPGNVPGHTQVALPEPAPHPAPAAHPASTAPQRPDLQSPPPPPRAHKVWRAAEVSQPMELWQSGEMRALEGPAPVNPPDSLHGQQSSEATQSPGFKGPVPVEQLVSYALATNPEIQAARYQARSLSARVPQARSLPDPQLITTAFLEEIQTAAGPQEVILTLGQKFPLFGKRPLRAQVAWYDAMAAYARVLVVELQVIERVKRAYYDVYFLQGAIRETHRLEKPLEDLIEVARTKYETNAPGAGLESVLQLQIELSKLKTRLAELEEARVRARAKLARELSLPPELEVDAVEPVGPTKVEQTAATLVSLAESVQPELEAWRRELARDRTAVALARRDYLPDATVSFNWFEVGRPGLSPVANGRDAFSLAVGVNLPIYYQRLEAQVREAQCKAAATARRYVAARDEVRSEVQSLYAELMEHQRILTILDQEIIPRAEQTFELSTESYRAGRAEFQQLIDAFRLLLQYRIERYRRAALREQAIASLERAVGETIGAASAP